jgi:hypothetical protein
MITGLKYLLSSYESIVRVRTTSKLPKIKGCSGMPVLSGTIRAADTNVPCLNPTAEREREDGGKPEP